MKPKTIAAAEADPAADPREIEAVLDDDADPAPVLDAPEVTPATDALVEWDTPPASTGQSTPRRPVEDDATCGEKLVQGGLAEADRDQRLAAADPDYEP